jgi:hypothetical protein
MSKGKDYVLKVKNHLLVGLAGTKLVKALQYEPEGSRVDSQWRHWYLPLTLFFRVHYSSGVDSASNRNISWVDKGGLQVPIVLRSGTHLLELLGPVPACTKFALLFY